MFSLGFMAPLLCCNKTPELVVWSTLLKSFLCRRLFSSFFVNRWISWEGQGTLSFLCSLFLYLLLFGKKRNVVSVWIAFTCMTKLSLQHLKWLAIITMLVCWSLSTYLSGCCLVLQQVCLSADFSEAKSWSLAWKHRGRCLSAWVLANCQKSRFSGLFRSRWESSLLFLTVSFFLFDFPFSSSFCCPHLPEYTKIMAIQF